MGQRLTRVLRSVECVGDSLGNIRKTFEVCRMWQLVVSVLDRGQGIRGVREFFIDVVQSLAELVSKSLE